MINKEKLYNILDKENISEDLQDLITYILDLKSNKKQEDYLRLLVYFVNSKFTKQIQKVAKLLEIKTL